MEWIAILLLVLLSAILFTIILVKIQGVRSDLNRVAPERKPMTPEEIAALMTPPVPPCRHTWKMVKDQTLEGTEEKKMVCILECEGCGELDKTIEVVKVQQPREECRHVWERQKGREIESAYEQMNRTMQSTVISKNQLEPWMYRKTYVVTRICRKCGEIDTVIASNYDLEEEAVESK